MDTHSTAPITTSYLLRTVNIEELQHIFSTFQDKPAGKNACSALKVLYNALGTSNELEVARLLQDSLYHLFQQILNHLEVDDQDDEEVLFSECLSLALYKLTHLYPSINTIEANATLNLSSGHHVDLDCLYNHLLDTTQESVSISRSKQGKKQQYTSISYIPCLDNPHTMHALSSRDMINFLCVVQKQKRKIPSVLIRVDQGDYPVFIGDKKTRARYEDCVSTVLHLEDIEFYWRLLFVDEYETPIRLLRFIQPEYQNQNKTLHAHRSKRIKNIGFYTQNSLFNPKDSNWLSAYTIDTLIFQHQHLQALAESEIIQTVIKEQRATNSTKKTLDYSNLCRKLSIQIGRLYNNQCKDYHLSDDDLHNSRKALSNCVTWLDEHTPKDGTLSLKHIKDFRNSLVYQTLNDQLCVTVLHHAFPKGTYSRVKQQYQQTKESFSERFQSTELHAFLKNTSRRLEAIDIDPNHIDQSLHAFFNNIQSDQFDWFIKNSILSVSSLTCLTGTHAHQLSTLAQHFSNRSKKTKHFLDKNGCKTPIQFFKLFFGNDVPQKIAEKLMCIHPLQNLQSDAVKDDIYEGVLSLAEAICLTDEERHTIEIRRNDDVSSERRSMPLASSFETEPSREYTIDPQGYNTHAYKTSYPDQPEVCYETRAPKKRSAGYQTEYSSEYANQHYFQNVHVETRSPPTHYGAPYSHSTYYTEMIDQSRKQEKYYQKTTRFFKDHTGSFTTSYTHVEKYVIQQPVFR